MLRTLLAACALTGITGSRLPGEEAARPAPAQPAAADARTTPFTEGEMTVITSEDSYLHHKQGILVFFRNVRMRDPRLNIDCSKQMQIVFEEEPEEQAQIEKTAKAPSPSEPKVKFSGIKTLMAEGDVVVYGKDPRGKPYQACGDKIVFDGKTGESILTGKTVRIIRDNGGASATGPDNYIHLHPDGSIYLHGDRSRMLGVDPRLSKPKKASH